jgi:hypothetical protein
MTGLDSGPRDGIKPEAAEGIGSEDRQTRVGRDETRNEVKPCPLRENQPD